MTAADQREDGGLRISVPDDLLAGHPATAYFWGRVAGNGEVETIDGDVVATFDDDRIEEARQAAAACPTNAIVVEEVEQ